jgi:hypothetical protein
LVIITLNLNHILLRKRIYAPIYAHCVEKYAKEAWEKLREVYAKELGNMALIDGDGYDYLELKMTLEDVMLDPSKKMGHAFVLAMMLENNRVWL